MRALPILTVVLLTSAPAFAAQTVVPSAFPSSRYEKLKSGSPFALATPVVAPEAPKDSFTKDWILTSLNLEPDSQGVDRYFVSIMTRDQTERFYLFGNEPNKEGVSIHSVERSPVTGRSKVTLKKGDEYGTVSYDEMLMQSTSGQNAPMPGMPGQAGAMTRPHPLPGISPGNPAFNQANPGLTPVRQPLNRPGGIPRPNPPLPQMNNGAAPYPNQPAQDTRRRVRVINSKP